MSKRTPREALKLRHPMLKLGSYHYLLYQWIRAHPHSTANEISAGTYIDFNTVIRRTAELKNALLVKETGKKYCAVAGRKVGAMSIIEGNEEGKHTEKVILKVKIYVDEAGKPSAVCTTDGSDPVIPPSKFFILKSLKVDIPTDLAGLQTFAPEKDSLIIDGNYEIMP
jgi:hypothetical protein